MARINVLTIRLCALERRLDASKSTPGLIRRRPFGKLPCFGRCQSTFAPLHSGSPEAGKKAAFLRGKPEETATANGTYNERGYGFLCNDPFGEHGVTALFLR
jgi:hypothetical protein